MTGVAELPLHEGHVPRWLAEYMKRLAKAIIEVIVEFYGPRRFVVYMADPIWFQAFNNIKRTYLFFTYRLFISYKRNCRRWTNSLFTVLQNRRNVYACTSILYGI